KKQCCLTGSKSLSKILTMYNTSYKDKEGQTALHLALKNRRTDVAKWLLRKGADPNLADKEGLTALHIICEKKYNDLAKMLFEISDKKHRLVHVDAQDKKGNTPLHLALYHDDKEVARLLLRRGADITLANEAGKTLLHIDGGSCDGDESLRMLFEMRINDSKYHRSPVQIDARNKFGETPLHSALCWGNKEAVEFLLRRGADPNLTDQFGHTALHVICRSSCNLGEVFFMVNDELNRQVRVNAKDENGRTPLYWALERSHNKMIELLLRRGADPNLVQGIDGSTPLHFICKSYSDNGLMGIFLKIMTQDRRETVPIDARDKYDRTPLQYAVARLLPSTVDVLLDHGADLSNFVFPSESLFDFGVKFKDGINIKITSGILAVVERLESRGYELSRSDALTIMKLFAKHKLFVKSADLEEPNWHDHEEVTTEAKETMISPSLSVYDLLHLRPREFRWLVSRRRTWTCFFLARCRRIATISATTTDDNSSGSTTVAMSDSIQVAIKVRPLIRREKDENLPIQWLVSDNTIAPTDPEKKSSSFQFDHIFDSQKNNDDVFQTVVKPIVGASVNGINGTVFAYGQTSSGKTHTMMGTASEPGIIPLAVEHMFDAIAETCHREFLLRVSYLEIYNEKVNDLLDTSATDLKLREDSNGYVQVLNSKEEIVSSPDNILALMKKGLSTKIPDILELWKPNIFNEEGGEVDTFAELKKLERILEDLENEASHGEPKLTALEKKLTDDYNECAEELKQVQVQKELLITENLELKQDLLKESDKQKKNEGLMQNLRVDTDCLMAKLIEKNNELSKLKERVVELEKSNSEMSASFVMDTSVTSESGFNTSSVKFRIKELEDQVESLTIRNKKLSELKLTNCNQCDHLKELNESRRLMKLEIKTLNQRLEEVQKKYEKRCEESESLITNAHEGVNTSLKNLSMLETTLNESCYEGLNVTVMEEKVHQMSNVLEEMQENNARLSNQCQEKCLELEKLQAENISPNSPTSVEKKRSKSNSRKTSARIQTLLKDVERMSSEFQELKRHNDKVGVTLDKFRAEKNDVLREIETLKEANNELKNQYDKAQTTVQCYEDKIKLLEEELESLYKKAENTNATEVEIQTQKLEIEVQCESLLKEKNDLLLRIEETEDNFKKELESCNSRIGDFEKENNNLKNEILKLEDIVQNLRGNNQSIIEDKLQEEVDEAKSRMIKEIKSMSNLSEEEVRNSTSKVRVENEMQDLQDENRSLKNHLEGSYNRIKELQESKSQVQRELSEAQGKVEILEHELNANKIALESLRDKYNNDNLQKLRDHYDELLREKNNIVLEVEEKKMIIASKDQKLVDISAMVDVFDARIFVILSCVGYTALFPLLYPQEFMPLKLILWFIHLVMVRLLFKAPNNSVPLTKLEKLYIRILPLITCYETFLHKTLFKDKLPFLPLAITSIYCALGITYSYALLYYNYMCKDNSSLQKLKKTNE
ncbi:unnamed protein product, partial [Trichogramma brassicae]